ncbi:MAG: hypothetical protein ACJ0GV_00990 [Dehalococcoidia bacterium]|tara:strand:+ start:58 stop:1422 length:1365 start_codon:yes stop_codon:yes gene_type:complete
MKILYCLRNKNIFNYNESIIENLSENGHIIKIIFSNEDGMNENSFDPNPEERIKNLKNTTFEYLKPTRNFIQKICFVCREIKNYQRYFHSSYRDDSQHSFYQERWTKYLPVFIRFVFTKISFFKIKKIIRFTNLLFNFIEKISGYPKIHKKIIDNFEPDLIIGSPGNLRFSEEIEFIKYGKTKNIITVICVLTWDNLTTKGGFNVVPDKFIVWNKFHKNELLKYHQVDQEKIIICGSPFFDKWFSKKYSNYSENLFNEIFDLNSNSKFLIYLGSSSNLGKNDEEVIKEILIKLNQSILKDIFLIIKPHLTNQDYLKNFEDISNVRLWKNNFSDNWVDNQSLFKYGLKRSICSIGLNTTAMIDSVINKCPVISIIYDKNLNEPTNSAIHFKTMIESDIYTLMDDLSYLEDGIEKIQSNKTLFENKRNEFIQSFVRPVNLNIEVGEIVRKEIEGLV